MASFYLAVIQAAIACLLIILVGYLFSKFKVFDQEEFSALNAFSSKIAFPFLLFRSLASRPFKEITFDPLISSLLTNISTQILLIITFAFPFDDKLYMFLSTMIGSCYINYIILGLPIFTSIWGNNYNQVPAICSFCHYIELVPLFLILAQIHRIKKEKEEAIQKEAEGNTEVEANSAASIKVRITIKDVGMAFWTALKTPLVVGNILGLIWSAIGIPYYTFFSTLGDRLGDCISIFALVSIGRFLEQKSLLSCHILQLVTCLIIRFFVFPALAMGFALALKFPNRTGRQCVVCAMLPAANAAFVLAHSVGIGANVCSAMVFWSLVFIVPILILWFYIMDKYRIFIDDLSDIT